MRLTKDVSDPGETRTRDDPRTAADELVTTRGIHRHLAPRPFPKPRGKRSAKGVLKQRTQPLLQLPPTPTPPLPINPMRSRSLKVTQKRKKKTMPTEWPTSVSSEPSGRRWWFQREIDETLFGACAPRECNSQASAPPRPALLARAPGAALLAKGSKPVCVGCPHLPPARCGAASSKSTMNHGPSRSAWSRGWQSSHDGAQERRTERKRSFAKCVGSGAWCVVRRGDGCDEGRV